MFLVSCGGTCVDLGQLPDLFIAQVSHEECLTHWLAYGKKAIAGSYGYEKELKHSKFTLGP